jgi:hypothetical protein
MMAAGAAFLAMAGRGVRSGELRAGLSGFRPYRPTRTDNPLGFYFYLLLYLCVGTIWVQWGIAILAGFAPPLRWR